jgi:hypothetical protein
MPGLTKQKSRAPSGRIAAEVVFAAVKCYEGADNRFEAFEAMRQTLLAQRERDAAIAEEFGRPDIAFAIRGEA